MQLTAQQQFADKATRDREFGAAAAILLASPFASDRRVVDHILPYGAGIHFPRILEETGWSPGERFLIEAAGSLFNGGTRVNLAHAAALLDREALHRLFQAIAIRARAA
jgi:hypothetical protein